MNEFLEHSMTINNVVFVLFAYGALSDEMVVIYVSLAFAIVSLVLAALAFIKMRRNGWTVLDGLTCSVHAFILSVLLICANAAVIYSYWA